MTGEPRQARERAGFPVEGLLGAHAAASAALGFAVTLLWALTDRGYFWPIWVWFGLGVLLSLHWLLARTVERSSELLAEPAKGWTLVEMIVTFKLPLLLWSCLVIAAIWLLTGPGALWPRWPWLGLLFLAGVDVYLLNQLRRRRESGRERKLTERVGELTRTRRGALEAQADELRRVERDLHDGAQSRLVALSLKLGRAEAKLAMKGNDDEVATLIREARADTNAAIAELRDLARGIAPPILADRGLEAAVRSLAARATGPVTIEADLGYRPATVIETAAYFVVAEALTNAAKHANGAALRIRLDLDADRLLVEVADNGPGGANPSGNGLAGLRQRVEALDGDLAVNSPVGMGTAVAASFPVGPDSRRHH